MIGDTLGSYEILELLGEGGMGRVYRARDTTLGRDVAIKVLPREFAADVERRSRFEREARSIAALDHPNIVTVFSIEEVAFAGGSVDTDAPGVEPRGSEPEVDEPWRFITMQLVKGQPLSDHIARGGMALDRFFRLAIPLADAIGAAHEAGIMHRDLKPANVMLSDDGRVKVLDFGLAKLRQETVDTAVTDIVPAHITEEGKILGTVAYMSPEQAEGRSLDQRSDIFSLGILLYEMATGERPFKGDTRISVISSIMKDAPASITAVNRGLPRHLGRIVRRCLQKDPGRRYQSAIDLRNDLEDLREEIDSGELERTDVAAAGEAPDAASSWWRVAAVAVAAAALGVVVAVSLGWLPLAPSAEVRDLRMIPLTANPDEDPVIGAAISPDGTYLAYTDSGGIHLRLIETGVTQALTLSDGYAFWEVAWYPDGARLVASGVGPGDGEIGLFAVPVLGGTPTKLASAGWRPKVSPDGSHIAYLDSKWPVTRIWVVTATGEDPEPVVEGEPGDSFWHVGWSPDSTMLAYGRMRLRAGAVENGHVEALHLESGDVVPLYSSSATTLEVGPRLFQNWRGILPFVWAPDGRLIVALAELPPNSADSNLWSVDVDPRSGATSEPVRITQLAGVNFRDLFLTADGRQLSFLTQRNREDVYVGELSATARELTAVRQVTLDERVDRPSGWMTDSRTVMFASDRGSTFDTYTVQVDGGGEPGTVPTLVFGTKRQEAHLDVSPDGKWFLSMEPGRIVRKPVVGGPSEKVLALSSAADPRIGHTFGFDCAAGSGAPCVVGEVVAERVAFRAFDPFGGWGEELGWLPTNSSLFVQWALSRDGGMMAAVDMDNRIQILDLSTGDRSEVAVDAWTALEFVTWAADGSALLVNGFSTSGPMLSTGALLRVGLDGEVTVLRQRSNEWIVMPHVSPDGRYVAYGGMVFDSNASMLEGF